MDIKIEKNIPIQEIKGRSSKYAFEKYEVGDSAFYPGAGHTFQTYAGVYGKKNNKRFTTRAVEENGTAGIRVWRIE